MKIVTFTEMELHNLGVFLDRVPLTGTGEAAAIIDIKRKISTFELHEVPQGEPQKAEPKKKDKNVKDK